MNICAFPHQSTPDGAARILATLERELATLLATPNARDFDSRCADYRRLIEEYRAKATTTAVCSTRQGAAGC